MGFLYLKIKDLLKPVLRGVAVYSVLGGGKVSTDKAAISSSGKRFPLQKIVWHGNILSQDDRLALLPASRGESLPSGEAQVCSRKVGVVPSSAVLQHRAGVPALTTPAGSTWSLPLLSVS